MRSIGKNLTYNTAYQVLLVILPFITGPYLARTLGVTATGIYSYANSVANYFLLIGALGISNHANRSIAMVREDQAALNRTFSGVLVLQFVMFALSLTAYAVYVLGFVVDNKLVALLQFMFIASGMLDISWLYFGLEEFKTTVLRNAAIKVATLVAILVFVHNPGDLWKYTLIMVLGQLISQLYLWFRIPGKVTFVKVSAQDVLKHLKPALILFIPVLAYSVYKIIDKIMLGNMTDYDQVGMFTSAEKIIAIPVGILAALGTVMLPRITNMVANGEEKNVQKYIRISTKAITIITAAVGFGLIGISKVFTEIFYGAEYPDCSGLVILLSISVFFVAWANVSRTQYLIPMHRDRIYLISTISGAVVNVSMNLWLIPQIQATGAAISTIFAEMTVMLIQSIAIRKEVPMLRYVFSYLPVLVIGGVMAVIVWFIGSVLGPTILALMLQITVGGTFFVVFLLIYLKLSKDECWEMLVQGLRKVLRKK